MSAGLVLAAAFAPVCGGLMAGRERSALRAGRWVAAGCGLAAVAALWLLGAAGRDGAGSVGGGPVDLRVDRVGAILLVVALATGAMVASFARRGLDDDGRAGRFFALLGAVVTGSALVVLPGAGWLLLLGWLASGWALAGLIGFARPWARVREEQRRLLRTLAVGDVALLVAVAVAAGTSDAVFTGDARTAVTDLRASSFGGVRMLDVVAVALVVAGATRSALFPFHRWLIGTLVAPTPVSALVHAGFVSGAGLLLVRFAPVFVASDVAVILAFAIGVVTVVLASAASLVRADVKGALVWSTVSQMGFMVVQCAVGAFSSAAFHIAGHGMYKAALFLGAGDTASAGLRSRRRPGPARVVSPPVGRLLTVAVPTASVAVTVWLVPPDVSGAGQVLVVVFAWLSAASALRGWLRRAPMDPVPAAVVGGVAVFAAIAAYVGGLRLVEQFVKPSLPTGTSGTIIGPGVLVATLVAVAAGVGAVACTGGPTGVAARSRWRRTVVARTVPTVSTVARRESAQPRPAIAVAASDDVQRAQVRGEVSRAAAIVAPLWPLSSFVAVNPLGGLETLGFDEATATARRWTRGRTHLSLADYRYDHHRGLTTDDDLRLAVHLRCSEACAAAPVEVGGRRLDPVEIILTDLLHGPEPVVDHRPRTALERLGPDADRLGELVDDVVADWIAGHVAPAAWPAGPSSESLVAMCRRDAIGEPRLARVLDPAAREWIAGLDDDPAAVIIAAFAAAGVAPEDRIHELRGHLARLIGWSGLAKWRNEWAHADERLPDIAPVDVAAVRAMVEAAVLVSVGGSALVAPSSDVEPLAARVDAVASVLAPDTTHADRAAIASVLASVPDGWRASLWLDAQERRFDDRLLGLLDRVDPGPAPARPEVQMVFCIDVRSEGLRRHLESLGTVETLGFAGFFGVPMRVRQLGWDRPEARCPVLVAPAITAVEHARHESLGHVAASLARRRSIEGARSAHRAAKHGPGAPFALAETAGWLVGPRAMVRTWLPRSSRPLEAPATTIRFDDDESLVQQRVFFAEAVLNTMGLVDRFAPLVVLCGHTSTTVNNLHATALECGACGGASGDGNARAVAALLNAPEIRHHLVERGITIPDDTWFLAAVHDTASDHVTLLDTDDAPPQLAPAVDELTAQLRTAGALQSQSRAALLPGSASRVRDRGADWAQVRPEWGLARNAAFVIGPRSITAGLDLDGRAFLHTYDAALDPTGRVLETIMTAPLVVAHWISSQYYFSTVDPEVFGAGDKLLHNPIGTVGVISGDRGDLRVGLPLQSTHLDGRRHHQPVRLLAVIQADLVRIETIIANNPILRTLTAGSWLRVAGRSHAHEPWSTRTPNGTWMTIPRTFDDSDSLIDHLTTEPA